MQPWGGYAPQGFSPVFTFRYTLDHALAPLLPHVVTAALASLPELHAYDPEHHMLPAFPLMIDPGGFGAIAPGSRVIEEGGLGVLMRPGGYRYAPHDVHAAQQHYATWGCTLDFPTPAALGDTERQRRYRLTLANTR